MAQATQIQKGHVADYTPGSDVDVGDVVLQGSLFGIAGLAIEGSALGSLIVDGIFDVLKVGGAISAGELLYWDPTGDPETVDDGSGACTGTAGALKPFGWAIQSALTAATTARVKVINVNGIALVGALTQPIADPVDEAAIPITADGHVALVTDGGSEARSLADPTVVGQQLLLYFKVDAGDCVVTAASAINQNADTIMTFSDIGEAIQLVAIEDASGSFEWRVVFNDGVVLS